MSKLRIHRSNSIALVSSASGSRGHTNSMEHAGSWPRLHVGKLEDLTRRGLGYRSLQSHPEESLALRVCVPGQVSATPEKESQFLGLEVRRQGLEEHQDQLVPSFI